MFDRTLNIPSTSSHFLLHILQLAISIRRADRPCFVGPWHSSSLCIRLSNRTGVTIATVKKSKHIESRLIQIGYWPQSLQCRELLFSIARSCENESWQPVGILVRLGKEKIRRWTGQWCCSSLEAHVSEMRVSVSAQARMIKYTFPLQ